MSKIDVDRRPKSRGELAAWYSAALSAQASSGLSMAKFAARVGVGAPTLYQWRRRLEASGGSGRGRPKLVEVTITGSGNRAKDEGLVVRLCDGRRSIGVPRDFDGDDLRRLVTVLEGC